MLLRHSLFPEGSRSDVITGNNISGRQRGHRKNCCGNIFTYEQYLQKPDEAGKFLAQDSPVEADLVTGVPESGNAAALGYSLASGIPYGTAFVKNSYVGRTFIKPKQSSRESSVQVKLNVLRENAYGYLKIGKRCAPAGSYFSVYRNGQGRKNRSSFLYPAMLCRI